MKCENCKELEAKIDALNANIEDMFIFAFASGFKSAAEKAIKATSDTITGAMDSGLFPDLARIYMKEYFQEDNPPQGSEKK